MEEKKLGLFRVSTLGIGGMLGSGIFIMMGYGTVFAGRSTSLAFIVCVLMMTMAYAFNWVLGSMFKLKGGAYEQLIFLCSPIISGFYGVSYFIGSTAIAAYGISLIEFIGKIFPQVLPYKIVLAVLVSTIFFAISIKGIGFMAYVQSAMTVIMVIALGMFIILGLPKVQPGYFSNPDFFYGGPMGFFSAVSVVSFACMGTTAAPVSVAYETKNATKTVPLATLIIAVVIAVIYSLTAVVFTGVLPIEQVMGQDLSTVAEVIFPHWFYVFFVLGGAVFAIATSLLGNIAMMRYPILSAAEDGWLPKPLAKTTRGGVPWVTTLIMYLFAVVPIILDVSIDTIVSYVMIPQLVIVALANIMMFTIPKKYPEQWKKSMLHMPYSIFCILVTVSIISSIILIYFMYIGLGQAVIPTLVMTIALFLYTYLRMKTGAVNIEKVNANKQAVISAALEE